MCAVPKQFEMCNGRRSFSSIYYLAVVSDDDVLEERMRRGRGVTAESWIKSSLDFNRWLKEHANETIPKIPSSLQKKVPKLQRHGFVSACQIKTAVIERVICAGRW